MPFAIDDRLRRKRAALGPEEREEWLRRAAALAEDGLRVLALAEKTIPLKGRPSL